MSGPYGKSDKTGRIKRLGRQASGISDALGASGTSVAWYKDFGRSKNAKLTKDEPQEKPLMSGDTETTPAEDTKLEGSGVADDQTVMTSRVSQILTGDSTGSPRASMISKRTLQRSSGKLVLDASDKQSESGQPWYRQFSNLRKDSKSARNLLANVQKVDPVEGEPTIHPFQHNQLADSKQQDITTNNRRSWLQMRSTDGRDLECQTVGTESVDDFFEHCVEMSAEVEEIRAAAKLRAKYSLDPSSSIVLDNAIVIPSEKSNDHSWTAYVHRFEIRDNSGRNMWSKTCCAPKNERDQWVQALSIVMKSHEEEKAKMILLREKERRKKELPPTPKRFVKPSSIHLKLTSPRI